MSQTAREEDFSLKVAFGLVAAVGISVTASAALVAVGLFMASPAIAATVATAICLAGGGSTYWLVRKGMKFMQL